MLHEGTGIFTLLVNLNKLELKKNKKSVNTFNTLHLYARAVSNHVKFHLIDGKIKRHKLAEDDKVD